MLFHCKLEAIRAFLVFDLLCSDFALIYGRLQPGGDA